MNRLLSDPRLLFPAALVLGGAYMLLMDSGSVFAVTDILIWVLFAASLNLLISFGGMVSFGHSAFFGLGAYGLALAIFRFSLPLPLAVAAGLITTLAGATIYGALCVRLTRIYFSMLTLACAEITFSTIFQWYDFTGGDTGLPRFVEPRLGLSAQHFGLVVLVVVLAGLFWLWRVIRSPLGLAIQAVGENPARARALGINTRAVQFAAFVVAAMMAGVAGMLMALFYGNVFPDYASLTFSIDVLIMVVLGGLHSFAGGIVGAVVYKLIDHLVSKHLMLWQMAIGVVLLMVIIFAPDGVVGIAKRLKVKLFGEARP